MFTMTSILEKGYKLNAIKGNSGVYTATNADATKSAVFVTEWDGITMSRASEWFRSEAAATAEAEALVRDRARELAFS